MTTDELKAAGAAAYDAGQGKYTAPATGADRDAWLLGWLQRQMEVKTAAARPNSG